MSSVLAAAIAEFLSTTSWAISSANSPCKALIASVLAVTSSEICFGKVVSSLTLSAAAITPALADDAIGICNPWIPVPSALS